MKLPSETMKLVDLLCLLMITGMITCEDKGFIRVVVRVGEDVVLPCSLGPEVNIEPALFDWMKGRQEVFLYNAGFFRSVDSQFQGRVSHFPDKLKNGNASIVIRNIQLSDSGNYSCYSPRPQEQRFFIELFVGAFAKPRVMILDFTEDQALLQCEVHGAFPKPQISWIDSDGTVLPATEKLENSDDLHYSPALTLQTNVTKTDIFRCRVTQEELNHITEARISTLIFSDKNDKTGTGSIGVHGGVALGCLIGFILGLVVAWICWWCRRRPNRERCDSGVSSLDSAYHTARRPNALNSPKVKHLVTERCDSGVSSLDSAYRTGKIENVCVPHHSSDLLETREPNEDAEPDEALKTPLQKTTFYT